MNPMKLSHLSLRQMYHCGIARRAAGPLGRGEREPFRVQALPSSLQRKSIQALLLLAGLEFQVEANVGLSDSQLSPAERKEQRSAATGCVLVRC